MTDRRKDGLQFSVASEAFAALTFPPTSSNALTAILANISGVIESIEAVMTDTEDGITYTVAITSATAAQLYSEASLGDNQTHYKTALSNKNSQDADFNPALVNGTLTLTVTPSAPPDNGSVLAKIATVTVTIYYR